MYISQSGYKLNHNLTGSLSYFSPIRLRITIKFVIQIIYIFQNLMLFKPKHVVKGNMLNGNRMIWLLLVPITNLSETPSNCWQIFKHQRRKTFKGNSHIVDVAKSYSEEEFNYIKISLIFPRQGIVTCSPHTSLGAKSYT